MKVSFNEEDRIVCVTAETREEVLHINRVFSIYEASNPDDLIKLAEALTAGTLTTKSHSEKRPWHLVHVSVDGDECKELIDIYIRTFKRLTGCEIPLLHRSASLTVEPLRVCFTGIYQNLRFEEGCLKAEVLMQSEPWNGMTSQQYAAHKATSYVLERIAERPVPPEFIQSGNGSFYRNPDYGTGRKLPLKPALTSSELWAAMWNWWVDNHANDAQKDVIDKVKTLFADKSYGPPWELRHGRVGGTFYVPDPNGTVNYDGKGLMVSILTDDQFANLK